jgi:hypothetical protein
MREKKRTRDRGGGGGGRTREDEKTRTSLSSHIRRAFVSLAVFFDFMSYRAADNCSSCSLKIALSKQKKGL